MEKSIKYKGTQLVYTDSGEGTCIVLLHGYLESGKIWQHFVAQFSGRYRFIIPDIPGHGQSGSWGSAHTMDELAGAVFAIMEAEGITRVFLAGHSMGGYITMAFAALYPESLSGYALVHSTPFADTEEKQQNREREIALVLCGKKRQIISVNIPKAFAMDNLEKMSAELEYTKQIALESPDEGMIALLNGMKDRPDRTSVLQDPRLPLLIIGGMKDNYIPAEVVDKLVALAPHARVLRLKESGHMGFMEEPGLVISAFEEILRETASNEA